MDKIKQELELKVKDMKECTKQITNINKQAKPLKDQRKQIKEYIISKMEDSGITDFDVDGTKYVLEKKNKSSQIKTESIRTTLQENGIKDINKILKSIQDKLEIKKSVNLKKK